MPPVQRYKEPPTTTFIRQLQQEQATKTSQATSQPQAAGQPTWVGRSPGSPRKSRPYGWVGSSLAFLSSTSNGDTHQLISEHPIYLAGVYEGETRGDSRLRFASTLPAKSWFTIFAAGQAADGRNGHGRARGAWRQHH